MAATALRAFPGGKGGVFAGREGADFRPVERPGFEGLTPLAWGEGAA